MARLEIEPTPNPNSLKITAPGQAFLPGGMESFGSAAEAARHPLGTRLFAVDGITNIFILPQFLTVSKRPDKNWNTILPAIERAIAAHFDENA